MFQYFKFYIASGKRQFSQNPFKIGLFLCSFSVISLLGFTVFGLRRFFFDIFAVVTITGSLSSFEVEASVWVLDKILCSNHVSESILEKFLDQVIGKFFIENIIIFDFFVCLIIFKIAFQINSVGHIEEQIPNIPKIDKLKIKKHRLYFYLFHGNLYKNGSANS
ncbi:hypothetical protein BpHYR1_003508 [Brachionus plicatilis]|uniref:Uncharacterized protein n=1 Tax=Brachionus plicatilis TaxID=10195 RepID=A0A3M7T3S6_BRAPC|nr:hypothetical protein BpHYR1_003508 [Brachionus plicatilis]